MMSLGGLVALCDRLGDKSYQSWMPSSPAENDVFGGKHPVDVTLSYMQRLSFPFCGTNSTEYKANQNLLPYSYNNAMSYILGLDCQQSCNFKIFLTPELSARLNLQPRETVGVLTGIATGGTLIAILLLIMGMACKYCFFKRTRKGANLRRRTSSRSSKREQPLQERISRIGDGPEFVQESRAAYTEEDIKMQKRRTLLGSRQFPRGDLLLLDKLGDGEYGPVYRGEAYGLGIKEKSKSVTVKMLATQATEDKKIRFEQDIALLSTINHLNVVGMLAVCTEDSPECILLDAGKQGDLLSYVREMKGSSEQWMSISEVAAMLKMADEVCLGLAYLASLYHIHKDVALRNCIIGYDGVVKVASFGLGPSLYPEAYTQLHGKTLPLRWMPPEAISSGHFTMASDLWAFGVLMWELFTYGELPFAEKTIDEVITFVLKDFGKLPKPEGCAEDVYSVMSSCWELEHNSRPSFLVLHEHIFELTSEIDLPVLNTYPEMT